ncbi:MAG: helix-turn-helix transcriptional regulator [Candidatus Aminicenantes bacterium]|nr:helix-turn-helix transcriptional regulator [Candidatus Aminicenantes bacterium]
MTSKALVAASTKPLVVAILMSGENYGYKIIQSVRRLSGGRLEWSEPMLYPLLKRLERDGLIQSEWKLTENKRFRRYFRLTEKGRKEQEQETAEWAMVNEILVKVLDPALMPGI